MVTGTTFYTNDATFKVRARFLSLTRSKLRLCSANHRAGYFSNLACDWLSIVWAYSKQEIENRPRIWKRMIQVYRVMYKCSCLKDAVLMQNFQKVYFYRKCCINHQNYCFSTHQNRGSDLALYNSSLVTGPLKSVAASSSRNSVSASRIRQTSCGTVSPSNHFIL